MFERYTEKARRVIFFARYEASQFGQPYIETEHILLGLLREDKALSNRLLSGLVSVESIRKQIEAHSVIGEKVSTSVDLPVSNECKRVMAYAAEEAERLGHKHIGSEHLLLGLLREDGCFAATLLKERGVKLDAMREELKDAAPPEARPQGVVGSRLGSGAPAAPVLLTDFARDLTQAAIEGRLEPLIGREAELQAIVEVLCRRFRRSAVLIGERGVGKSAIVDGLAQRIAGGSVPAPLLEQRVMVLDADVVAAWALGGRSAEDRMHQVIRALIESAQTIVFIDDLERFIGAAATSGSSVVSGILKYWLLRGKLVSIGASTRADYAQLAEKAPWVRECFTALHVKSLDEATTRQVLDARKEAYESFHGVLYTGDALDAAIRASARSLPANPLPGKALELLDAAGARVKARLGALPAEIVDAMKKQKLLAQRLDSAIQNHEFEKARFYSDEDRQERENLRQLHEKHHLDNTDRAVVTRSDVDEVTASWEIYPYKPNKQK